MKHLQVFLGEVAPNGVQTIEAPQVSQHGVSVTYTSTDYGSVFESANITVSAPFSAVAPKMPVAGAARGPEESQTPAAIPVLHLEAWQFGNFQDL